MKGRFAVATLALIVVLSLCLVYSRIEAHRAQIQREVTYRAGLEHFQRDLRLGMHRSEVESYLEARKITYSEISPNLDVPIGQEPSKSIFCERWDVYIEMAFTRLTGQTGASSFDNLDSISVRKIGACL
jgi:hypothetical protein